MLQCAYDHGTKGLAMSHMTIRQKNSYLLITVQPKVCHYETWLFLWERKSQVDSKRGVNDSKEK